MLGTLIIVIIVDGASGEGLVRCKHYKQATLQVDRGRAGEGPAPIVIFCAGGNDIEKVRSVELRERFREALQRVRSLGGVPVVCGVLPRRYQSRQ